MVPPASRRAAAALAGFLVLAAGITCTEGPTGPRKSGVYALVGMSPVFSQAATRIYHRLAAFELEIDNIRIRLERENGEVAVDTVVAITAGQDSIVVKLSVEILEGTQEQFEATLEFRDGTQVLFSGTQTITASLGLVTPPVPSITVEYTGPGATVTTLDVQPDTTISGLDDITMRAIGRDANNQVVSTLNLEWSVDNPNMGAMTAVGVFLPIGTAGNAVITAALPTGIQGSATVTITPPAAVVLVSGGEQTGQVGTALEAPIVVEVQSTIGAPMAGHSVSFAVTAGGGSISPPIATTGANGRATAHLTLGTTAGVNTVQITAAGLTPITATATGIAGPATRIAIAQQPSTSAAAGQLLATQPKVQLQDAFGNSVAQAGVAVTADLNPAGGLTLHGTATRTTNAAGLADFTDLVISGTAGSTALRFSAPDLASATSQSIAVTAGAAAQLAIVQQPSATTTSGVPFATQPKIQVRDASGNNVAAENLVVTAALTTADGRTLGGTPSRNTNASGVAEFTDLSITGPTGIATLTFTQGSLTSVTSAAISIASGTATSVAAVNALTLTDSAGANVIASLLPSVVVKDAANNPVTGIEVKFRRHGGAGSTINAQPDTLVLVTTDASGVAALTGRRLQTLPGFDTVLVTAAGLNDTVKFVATVTHASATHLAFVQQPSTGTAGQALSPAPTVEVRDAFFNRVTTGASATATISITLPASSVTGTTNVAALAGLATFSGLIVPADGTGLQLVAAVSGLTSATSNSFSVTSSGATTRFWISAASGTWETASSWSGGVVPGPQDTAVIASNGTYAVSISSAVNVAKVVVGVEGGTGLQLLVIAGPAASLVASDSIKVTASTGAIQLSSSAATALSSGAMIVRGTLQWFEGTIAGSQTIRITSGATMSISGTGPKALDGRTLVNQGFIVFDAGEPGDLTLMNGATIENESEAEFYIYGEADIVQGAGAAGSVTNFGALRRTPVDNLSNTIGVAYVNSSTAVTEIYTGALVFTGPTLTNTVNATFRGTGTIDVQGTSVTNAGTFAPGFSPGALTVNGSFPMQGTSKVVIELAGTVPGTEYDVLTVTGNCSLSGTLEVLLDGFTPEAGQTFNVLTCGSRTNTFGTITGLDLGGGLTLEPVYSAIGLSLVAATSEVSPTITWVNPSGGNWSAPSNWSTGVVPVSTDIVGIQMSGTYTVTLDVDPTVAGLIVGGSTGIQTLSGANRVLTINGASTIAAGGVLSLAGPASPTLTGTGSLTNSGSVLINNGGTGAATTFNNQGFLRIHGSSTLFSGPVVTSSASTILVLGSNTGTTAHLTVANGFTNNGVIELSSEISSWTSQLSVSAGTLTNAPSGTIRTSVGTGGARTLAAQLDNQGTLDVNAALTLNKSGADHVNSGMIDLQADVTITQSGTGSFANTADIALGASRTLTVNGGTLTLTNGLVTGPTSSCLVISGGFLDLASAAVGVPLTISSTTDVIGDAIVVGSGETLILRGGTVTATLTINSGGTVRAWGTLGLNDAVTLNAGGALRVEANSVAGTAATTITNGFTNNGVIEMNSTSGNNVTLTVNGTLTNASGAQIQVLPGNGGSRTLAAELVNQASGTVTLTTNLTLSRVDAHHENAGTITTSSGTLTVTQSGSNAPSFTNTGAITLGANDDLSITGGLADLDAVGSLVSGDATSRLVVSGTTPTLAFTPTTVTVPLTLTNTSIQGGSVTIASGETVRLLNGTLADPVTVQAGGTLWTLGTVTVNTLVMPSATSTLRVRAQSPVGGTAATTITNGFTNNGVIEMNSTSGNNVTLTVTNSALLNATGATIQSVAGSGGSRTLAAELNNEGTLDVDQALTISRANAIHLNGGTFDMTANVTITQSGTTPSFTNNGTIAVPTSQTFTVNGGVGTFTNGSLGEISGTGTVNVSATTFTNDGQVSPGSATTAGTLTFTGNFTQTTNGRVNIKLGGIVSGSSYDVLAISGAATLTGVLNVTQLNGFIASPLQSFNIISYGSRTGTFAAENQLVPLSAGSWAVPPTYGVSQLTVSVLP